MLPVDDTGQAQSGPVSGNPAATNFPTGIGWLGRTLGIPDPSGLTLDGICLSGLGGIAAGGMDPGVWRYNNLVSVGLTVDADRLVD